MSIDSISIEILSSGKEEEIECLKQSHEQSILKPSIFRKNISTDLVLV